MLGRNKNKRTMDKRGEEEFRFDFHKEKNIYLYLWRMRLKEKKLQEKEKFDTYIEWKQYVWNKYVNFSKEELIEFCRYLNQRKRNLKPNREYVNIFIPVILTLVIGEGIKHILTININVLTPTVWWHWLVYLLAYLLIMLVFVLPMLLFCYHTMKPIWDNNSDENFLADYKEIIDEILQERSKTSYQSNVSQDLSKRQIRPVRKNNHKDREWKFEIRLRKRTL